MHQVVAALTRSQCGLATNSKHQHTPHAGTRVLSKPEMLVIYEGYTGLQKIAPAAARLTQCQRGLGGDSGIATRLSAQASLHVGFGRCLTRVVSQSKGGPPVVARLTRSQRGLVSESGIPTASAATGLGSGSTYRPARFFTAAIVAPSAIANPYCRYLPPKARRTSDELCHEPGLC